MMRQGGSMVERGGWSALLVGLALAAASLGMRVALEGGATLAAPVNWLQAATLGIVGMAGLVLTAAIPARRVAEPPSPSQTTGSSCDKAIEKTPYPYGLSDSQAPMGVDSVMSRDLNWVDPRDLPRWFNTLWSSHGDPMRVTDPNGTMIAVNDAFCALVNKPRPALVGRPLSVIHAKERQEHVLDSFRQRSVTRTIEPTLERHYTLWNGVALSIQVSNLFLIGSRAPYPYILSIFRDVEAIRATEDRLRMMEAVAEQINHGALLAGPEAASPSSTRLRVTWFNEPIQHLLGRSRNGMIGLDATTLPAEDADPAAVDAVHAALRDGMPVGPLHLRLRHGEGEDRRASVAARVRLCPVGLPRLNQTHWLIIADPLT